MKLDEILGWLKKVFWEVEVELYPLRCFFNLIYSLLFQA